MRDNETDEGAKKLTGCGAAIAIMLLALVVGLFAAVIFVLFNIGAWIGGQ